MGEIGSGNNSSYPGELDTNSIPEVNSPAVGKTKARKEPIEDLTDAMIKVETELGTDPAGSLTNVKTFLQTQHQTDGTHKNTHGPHKWIDASDYDTLTDAINAAIGKTLVISSSINLTLAEAVGGAIVIPNTVLGIFPMAPGVINKNTATSLTINGPVVGNPMHQWLSGFADGQVKFNSYSTGLGGNSPILIPQWWGAKGNNVTNDWLALQCAITAAKETTDNRAGGIVYIPPGVYNLDAQLSIIGYLKMFGAGRATVLHRNGTVSGYDIINVSNASYVYLSDFSILCTTTGAIN